MKSYTLSFEHGDYKWQIKYDYSDIKDLHKTLAKLVKAEIGKSCSDITKYLIFIGLIFSYVYRNNSGPVTDLKFY